MASRTAVKNYLAHWFQLGKQVLSDDGRVTYQPKKVIQGDHFTAEFEDCWQAILKVGGQSLYLRGTDQTIAQLLSPAWDMVQCARCDMPVPVPETELEYHPCPCDDLPSWPNEEIPRPRMPVSSQQHLDQMKKRLELHSSEA